jgi:hypothetical protein
MGAMAGWEHAALPTLAPTVSCYFLVFQRALVSPPPAAAKASSKPPVAIARCRDGSLSLFAAAEASLNASISQENGGPAKSPPSTPTSSPTLSPQTVTPSTTTPSTTGADVNGRQGRFPGGAFPVAAPHSSAPMVKDLSQRDGFQLRACLSSGCVDQATALQVAEFARPLTTLQSIANGALQPRESPAMQAVMRGEFANPCFCFAAVMVTPPELKTREAQMMVCSDLAGKLNAFIGNWNREQDLGSMSSRLSTIRVHSTIDGLF